MYLFIESELHNTKSPVADNWQFEFFHAYASDWNLSYASHGLFLLQEFSPETIYLLAFAVYWTLDPSHK